jgi:hypothetical protein
MIIHANLVREIAESLKEENKQLVQMLKEIEIVVLKAANEGKYEVIFENIPINIDCKQILVNAGYDCQYVHDNKIVETVFNTDTYASDTTYNMFISWHGALK